MSPELLSTIMIALLAFLFFLTFLGVLAGLIKGLYKTAVKSLILAALLVVFLFVTPSISNSVGNIDLSNFNLSFSIGDETVVVTTIQETLANVITSTGLISPMNGISIYETAIALANSFLSYVLFFVMVLLTQLFLWLFTTIIYNGIFRWFLPVETKKQRRERKLKKKEERYLTDGIYFSEMEEERQPIVEIDPDAEPGSAYAEDFEDEEEPEETDVRTGKRWPLLRIPGALLGGCAQFVLAVSLFAPFTALARTVVDHRETFENILAQMFPEQAEDISSYIDVIDNSAFFQFMGVGNFDTAMMNKASQVTIGGQRVSFNQILASSLDIAKPLLESDAITFESGSFNITVNYARLLDSAMVHQLVEGILANQVLTSLLPPLIDIGIHSLSSSLPVGDLDFSDIDWTDEITAIDSAYSSLYQTGLVSTLFSSDGTALTPDNFSIPVNEWSDEEYATNVQLYTEALEKLGDMEVLQKNLPVVLSSLSWSLYSSGYDIFPTDVEAYADVDWGHDLALLGKSVLALCRTMDLSLSAKTDFTNLGDTVLEEMRSTETLEQLRQIILGSDQPTSLAEEGLLDMDLFDVVSLSGTLYSTLNSVSALRPYLAEVDFSQFETLGKQGLKDEFRLFFDMAEILFAEDSPIHIEDGLDGIDFTDPLVSETFVDILDVGEDSRVFTALYPTLIRTFLFDTTLQIEDYLYGLTPYDFNFEAPDFTTNFKKLVGLMPELYDLYTLMSDDSLSTKEQFSQLNAETIGSLLEIVATSDFFNPAQSSGIHPGSAEGRNFNVYVVLKNVLSRNLFQEIGFVPPDERDVSEIVWMGTEGQGEINRLVSLIQSAQQNIDFLLDMENEKVQDPEALKSMLDMGFESKLLEPSILSIIDQSMNSFLEEMGIHKTINQMRTELWRDDTDEIVALLTLIQELDLNSDDFFNTMDPEVFNALLTTLYRTNFVANAFGTPLVTGQETYVAEQRDRNFSEFLISFLEQQDLMGQLGIANFNPSLLYVSGYSRSTSTATIDGEEYLVTASGEIRGLTDLMEHIQDYGMENLGGGNVPAGFLTSFTPEARSSRLVRTLMALSLEDVLSNLELEPNYKSAVTTIDSSVLLDLSADEFQNEMVLFDHLYVLSQPDESGQTPLSQMLGNLVMLDDATREEFQSLLTQIGNSRLMTTKKEGTNVSPVSEVFKETFLNNDINGANLMKQVTLAEDDGQYGAYYDGIVAEIDDWSSEMEKLSEFLELAGQLGLTADTPFNRIFQNPENEVTAKALLQLLNRSQLFHRLPIYTFESNIDDPDLTDNLASLFVDPADPSRTNDIEYYVHLTTSDEDVAFWDNEIDYGVSLLFEVSEYMIGGFNGAAFADGKVDLSILYSIGNMELLRDVRSYLVYNLILQTANADVSAETVDSIFLDRQTYGANPNASRIERLFFSNPDLLDGTGKMAKARTLADIQSIQSVLNQILQNLDVALDGDLQSIADLFSFESLTESCFYEFEGEMHRSLLASEIVAGLIQIVFQQNTIWDQIPGGLPIEIDPRLLYGDLDAGWNQGIQYPLVNPVEGRALDGVIELTAGLQQSGSTSMDVATVRNILDSFSIDRSDASVAYSTFAASADYRNLFNARIVSSDAVASLLGTLLVTEEGQTPFFLASRMDGFSYLESPYSALLD